MSSRLMRFHLQVAAASCRGDGLIFSYMSYRQLNVFKCELLRSNSTKALKCLLQAFSQIVNNIFYSVIFVCRAFIEKKKLKIFVTLYRILCIVLYF